MQIADTTRDIVVIKGLIEQNERLENEVLRLKDLLSQQYKTNDAVFITHSMFSEHLGGVNG